MDITVLNVHSGKLCDVSAYCPNWQNIARRTETAGSMLFRLKWINELDEDVNIYV